MVPKAKGFITFLYYDQLKEAAAFYEDILGFEVIDDQQWARIYRVEGSAYLGIVAGEKGFHRPKADSAVLLTLVVDDVDSWYDKLTAQGVPVLRELETHEDIQVRCFFIQDPGGYAIEIQTFLNPPVAQAFNL